MRAGAGARGIRRLLERPVELGAVVRQLHVALPGHECGAAPEVLVADDGQRPRDALVPHVVVRPEERDELAAERADRAEVRPGRLELHVGRPVHVLGEHGARPSVMSTRSSRSSMRMGGIGSPRNRRRSRCGSLGDASGKRYPKPTRSSSIGRSSPPTPSRRPARVDGQHLDPIGSHEHRVLDLGAGRGGVPRERLVDLHGVGDGGRAARVAARVPGRAALVVTPPLAAVESRAPVRRDAGGERLADRRADPRAGEERRLDVEDAALRIGLRRRRAPAHPARRVRDEAVAPAAHHEHRAVADRRGGGQRMPVGEP